MNRQEMAVARLLIDRCIDAGWMVSLFDGEEWALRGERDAAKIISELGATCEEQIVLHEPSTKKKVGWVLLVWGNFPSELIADHTVGNAQLQSFITECQEFGEIIEEREWNV